MQIAREQQIRNAAQADYACGKVDAESICQTKEEYRAYFTEWADAYEYDHED